MDKEKLRVLLFEKTGMRIDVDDPVFTLVALNEIVLEEMTAQMSERNAELARTLSPLRQDLALSVGILKKEAGNLVEALRNTSNAEAGKLEVKSNALLDQHAAKASEFVSKAVAKSVHQPVSDAVTQVVAVANGLDAALMEVKTATSIMKTVAGQTVQGFAKDLDQVAKRVSWSWWERAALCFGSALFGALLALGIAKAAGWIGAPRANANVPAFSLDQKQK